MTYAPPIPTSARPLRLPGALIGMSLAGLFDGIVLHQILQWHHLICTTRDCHPASVADLKRMDAQDGWFHLALYAVIVLGITGLFRAGARSGTVWSGNIFWGAVLTGFGLFNVVEGLTDHHVLQIHHVRPGPAEGAWDVGFLIVSAVILAAGIALSRGLSRPALVAARGETS